MRATLVTTLLSGFGALAVGSSALADEPTTSAKCSGAVVLGVQGGYPYQDLGFDASKGVPVSQDVLSVTCGHVTADWWSSTQLSDGVYGHRGKGDEHDFEFTYANSVNTPIGPVNYVAYAAYFALDLGRGLGNSADDYVQVYGEVSRPIAIGKSWTLAPFVRYIHNFPLGNGDKPLDWVRIGGRLNGPVTLPVVGSTNASFEVAHATDLNAHGVLPYQEIWRGEIDFARPLGHGWTGTVGVKLTEHAGATPLIKFVHTF